MVAGSMVSGELSARTPWLGPPFPGPDPPIAALLGVGRPASSSASPGASSPEAGLPSEELSSLQVVEAHTFPQHFSEMKMKVGLAPAAVLQLFPPGVLTTRCSNLLMRTDR
ncbi:hypothetical protein BS78_09G057800 [Paspalum vaginatum]|nr:hypothetical protein BS78_09G057800 [Paspalum vaginatum]